MSMTTVKIRKINENEYSVHVSLKAGNNQLYVRESFYICESYIVNSDGKIIMKGGSVENGKKIIEFDEINIEE